MKLELTRKEDGRPCIIDTGSISALEDVGGGTLVHLNGGQTVTVGQSYDAVADAFADGDASPSTVLAAEDKPKEEPKPAPPAPAVRGGRGGRGAR